MKWHQRFMSMASLIASWSKDPSTKCGAVIVDEKHRVVSVGFNGFPAGTSDDPEMYANREIKLRRVIHAEKNAILFAQRNLTGCSIYIYPMPPCGQCAAAIIQSGISFVYHSPISQKHLERWGKEIEETRIMLKEAGVSIEEIPQDLILLIK